MLPLTNRCSGSCQTKALPGMPQHIEIDDRFVIKRKPIESETRAAETGTPVTKIPIGDLDESTGYPTSLRSSARPWNMDSLTIPLNPACSWADRPE